MLQSSKQTDILVPFSMAFRRTALALLAIPTLLASANPLIDLATRDKPSPAPLPVTNQTTCDGEQYTYQELAGYGFVPNDARDKFGDTLGGYGSSIAMDRRQWRKVRDGLYTGIVYAIPDRGWCVAADQYLKTMAPLIGETGTPRGHSTTRIVSTNLESL